MTDSLPHLAAVRYGGGDAVDRMLEGVVRALQAEGVNVGGYVQHSIDEASSPCATMHLEDVTSGERHLISQPLGRDARGCRLDPQALAKICGRLEATLERGVDLLVLNRFGKGEAEGHGFRTAIEKAMLGGVPVLTAVQDSYFPVWRDFAGDCGTVLAPERDEVIGWARSVLGWRGAAARPMPPGPARLSRP